MAKLTRRLMLGAAVAAPLAYIATRRPKPAGAAHDDYFRGLQEALREAGLHRPTLVVDRDRLRRNIGRLKQHLPKNYHFRIVAKSLPSLPLLQLVRAETGTNRLMVFHQPHVNFLAAQMPDTHQLVGKPMPIGAAQRFYDKLSLTSAFNPSVQLEWLVDTPERLREYRELAMLRKVQGAEPMALNLELDIGLRRGGFRSAQAVAEAIRAIRAEPALRFAGFMGYEPHVAKLPEILGGGRKGLDAAMKIYGACVDAARTEMGEAFRPEELTLNAGGSNTYQMYSGQEPCNELAVGSGLVKPTDFDTAGLQDHIAACFIATPVLKALPRTEIPGLEKLTGAFRAWDPNTARTFYLYGGYWLAEPVSPPGLQRNAIWGHSTNQDMLNGSTSVQLEADDHVFFRPHQSEFVFLQFGDIAVYEGGRIAEFWPVLPESETA